MGLSRTISETDVNFSRKLQNFPTPCTLRPHWRRSTWDWVSAQGRKKPEWWSYQMVKKVLR